MLDRVAEQAQLAVPWGEAEFCRIVRTVARSRQPSRPLEQVDMEVQVPIASDRSGARRMCARTSSGEMRALFSLQTVGARGVLPQRIRVDVSGHSLGLDRHWNGGGYHETSEIVGP